MSTTACISTASASARSAPMWRLLCQRCSTCAGSAGSGASIESVAACDHIRGTRSPPLHRPPAVVAIARSPPAPSLVADGSIHRQIENPAALDRNFHPCPPPRTAASAAATCSSGGARGGEEATMEWLNYHHL